MSLIYIRGTFPTNAHLAESIIAMLKECSVRQSPLRADQWENLLTQTGQRRKEHLSKLEAAQKEQSSAQSEEVERLRREIRELSQENENLRKAYGSNASSPGPSISPHQELTRPPSFLLPFASTGVFIDSTVSMSPSVSGPGSLQTHDTQNLVVVVPNNIREIRRSLHVMFAPILEIAVISSPQNHLATLAALAPTLPPQLKPTVLQLQTPHHAYIDMIPSPSLRDRLIAVGPANSNTFMTQACTLACDIEDTGQMIVWGEDWLNEFAWEFSAAVLERWGGWLLPQEWGQRANFWRRQRGAPILPAWET
jgi:hypothetical protein